MLLEFKTKNYKSFTDEISFSMIAAPKQKGLDYSLFLEKINKSESTKNKSTTSYSSVSKAKNVSSEINVIGFNVDEAIFVIDKFLDDCTIANLQTVRIVHGKGTGKLREGIHKFLKSNSRVKSFRVGTYGEGEMGVTVVELK